MNTSSASFARVAAGGSDLAHVAGNAGDALQSGLLIQNAVQVIRRFAAVPHQVDQNAGIHRARARSHHQTFERREAHRGIDALAVADRGQRTAVAQVAGDHAQRLALPRISAARRDTY